jgi:hypothetical protein
METPDKTPSKNSGDELPSDNKFTDVFLTDKTHNGKRYIATWVYSVLLLLSLFISILAIPALSNRTTGAGHREVKLQLEGTSTVHVSVSERGIEYIEISQPKGDKNLTGLGKGDKGEYAEKKCATKQDNYGEQGEQAPKPRKGWYTSPSCPWWDAVSKGAGSNQSSCN